MQPITLHMLKHYLYRLRTRLLSQESEQQIFFLNGSDALPAPLSREEEAAAFQALAAGDPLARETLIVHNLRLVVYIARKFDTGSVALDDLISIGIIGLMKAVETFQPEKNIKLATYASRCIENEILMHLRKIAGQRSEISFDEPLNVDRDGNELLLSDLLGTEPDSVNRSIETESEHHLLLDAVARLEPRERQIMEMRFGLLDGKEKTQKEVADALGKLRSELEGKLL